MSSLALDIGGANLKIAHSNGYAQSCAFPLWRQSSLLPQALSKLLDAAPTADRLAVTMTGELADCFESKAQGVDAIIRAVEKVADAQAIGVYLCDGSLVSPSIARSQPLLAAASNWHVLASFATRFCTEDTGLLIDLGSTTCDIIPLVNGKVAARGRSDPARLASHELVYTGVERSPVCAVLDKLAWQGQYCSVAQEVFATTLDAYLLLGDIAEESEKNQTADGRPRTREFAHARLARMICADTTLFTYKEAEEAAAAIRDAQLDQLSRATLSVLSHMETPPQTIVISGQGEFLVRQLLARMNLTTQVVSLTQQGGSAISQAACAYALATIAEERSDS